MAREYNSPAEARAAAEDGNTTFLEVRSTEVGATYWVLDYRRFDQLLPGGFLVAGLLYEDGDEAHVTNAAISYQDIDEIFKIMRNILF